MSPHLLFDRVLVRARRQRAANAWEKHDFLLREMVAIAEERLSFINRRFEQALIMGASTVWPESEKIAWQVHSDSVFARLGVAGTRLVCDDEWLPFAPESFDVIISIGQLHWVNDVPGALMQIQHALKPDGLFIGIFPGGESLHELRHAIAHGSITEENGLSPRLSPMMEVKDGGMLLQRAGFALPVADSSRIDVSYIDAIALMRDMRGMGETNALISRPRTPLKRATLAAIAAHYQNQYADAEGRIPATFELITLTGWKPHASQQKPARRGSGQVSLHKALEKKT